MGTVFQCFMLEPTDRAARWLRRYLSASIGDVRLCEPEGYHNAMVRIDDAPVVSSEIASRRTIHIDPLEWPEDDPRWPTRCQHCSYEFHERETRQLFYVRIWRTQDGREVTVHGSPLPGIEAAPPGAMFFADWYEDIGWKGPDGRSLCVVTPGGIWPVDGPSTNGDGWTRTGTPPIVTANPSIQIANRYHGWLRDGKLVEC